jgi:serine protease Do
MIRHPLLFRAVLAAVLAAVPVATRAASPALEMARQLNEAFVEVSESAAKSVVVINVQGRPERSSESELAPYLEQIPEEQRERWEQFMEYFRGQGSGRGGRGSRGRDGEEGEGAEPKAPLVLGQGSGMVVREDGYILTNNHVVEGAEEITVVLRDGRELKAEIRGRDPESDLAVIRLKEKVPGLVPVHFANSDKVRVGEYAIAIGAPFKLDYSVTFGHVSAKGRVVGEMRELTDQDFIQTDANINMGNSGGPLVNIDGEVIGVNSMIRTSMGAPVGIGFSIPSNLARDVCDRLIADGKFVRSWLGISIADLQEFRKEKEIETRATNGVLVRRIESGGPAENTELRPADVIVAVDGKETPTTQQLRSTVSRKKAGSEVTLDVVRGEAFLQVKVTAGEKPDLKQLASARRPKIKKEAPTMELGMTVKDLSRDLAKQFKVEMSEGVIITEVAEGSLAAQFELKPGDVVTDINHVPVTSAKEFRDEVRKAKGRVLVSFIRDGDKQFEVLKERSR